jgi:hypothetical protein
MIPPELEEQTQVQILLFSIGNDKHGLLVHLLTEGLSKDGQDDFDDTSGKAEFA